MARQTIHQVGFPFTPTLCSDGSFVPYSHMRQFIRHSRRSLSLVDENGKSLGTMERPTWWSQRQDLLVSEGALVVRSPKFFTTTISAFLNGVALMELRFPWTGGLIITPMHLKGGEFHIKRKNFFGGKWVILDDDGKEKARIQYSWNWKKMYYDPKLISERGEPLSALILLMAVHGIATQMRRAAAAST